MQAANISTASGTDTGFKGKRVLVVEDAPPIRALVTDMLQFAGAASIEAGSSEEGLFRARCEFPDLIIADIELPDLNGSSAARILKTDVETSEIPIIAITGSSTPKETALAEGCDGSLAKPFSLNEFLTELSRVCGPVEVA